MINPETKLKRVMELLQEWVKWEADMIMDDKVWRGDLPAFTQEVNDKYIDLISLRTEVISEVFGELEVQDD